MQAAAPPSCSCVNLGTPCLAHELSHERAAAATQAARLIFPPPPAADLATATATPHKCVGEGTTNGGGHSGCGMRAPQMETRNRPNANLLVSSILEKIEDSVSLPPFSLISVPRHQNDCSLHPQISVVFRSRVRKLRRDKKKVESAYETRRSRGGERYR
jgi:hypothetical protein